MEKEITFNIYPTYRFQEKIEFLSGREERRKSRKNQRQITKKRNNGKL